MNNLVRSPILVFILICCLDRERRSLNWNVGLARLFWVNLEFFEFTLMLSFLLYSMRIDNFMLFFDIKRLKFMTLTNSFHSIISSMFSLVLCMNTLWIMIPDMFVNHLSSSRSPHIMIIILNKIDRSFFRACIESIAYSLFSIFIIFSVLNNLLILLISYRSRRT